MSIDSRQAALSAALAVQHAVAEIHATLSRQIDLSSGVTALADYAWQGHGFASPERLEQALSELAMAEELCAANFILPNGNELLPEAAKDALRQLSLAAHARKSLDAGESVDIKELAALARVAEKTLRMATHSTRPGAMRVRKDGHWAYIEAAEALAWLGRRNDFHPTRERGDSLNQTAVSTAEELAATCKRWTELANSTPESLARALGWSAAQMKAYDRLLAGDITDQMTRFPPQTLCALAEHLHMPKPREFARDAFRVLAMKHADDQCDRLLAVDAG